MSFQDSNDSFFFFLLDNIATIQNIALRNFYRAIYIIDLSYKIDKIYKTSPAFSLNAALLQFSNKDPSQESYDV